MSTLLLTCSLLTQRVLSRHSSPTYGTCDDPFSVFKYAMATSDADKICENVYHIFPDIHEYVPNELPVDTSSSIDLSKDAISSFLNDANQQCAVSCHLELPDTCFQLRASESIAYDEGLLFIDSLESEISSKWNAAIQSKQYDAFMDYNIAFWVDSLDTFIRHWKSQHSADLQYLGIQWTLPSDLTFHHIEDERFQRGQVYSILVHSAQSQIQYEFISFSEPDLYDDVHWITDNIPRCTFQGMDEYPWNRPDGATIVPVRISRATSNTAEIKDFYIDIFDADVLYEFDVDSESISNSHSVSLQLPDTQIELQFVQRSQSFGDLTIDKFENLLKDTHSAVVSSPFCGQDRWMDNHFAYSTWTTPGRLDGIYSKLVEYEVIFKVDETPIVYASQHSKSQLESIGYEGTFTFAVWVIDPTGQTIQIGGTLTDSEVIRNAPLFDHQCGAECSDGMEPGSVDPDQIYGGNGDNSVRMLLNINGFLDRHNFENMMIYVILGVFALALVGNLWLCTTTKKRPQSTKVPHRYGAIVS